MIEVTSSYDIRGNVEQYSYRWIGKEKTTRVSYRYVDRFDEGVIDTSKRVGQDIQVGPFRLRVIDFEIQAMEYLCVRKDWPLWWTLVLLHRMNRTLDLAYRRLIITLAVWRLADYDAGSIPTWKDIHLVRRIKKGVRK